MTPSAMWSFAAKIAVTSGLRPRASPCRYPDRVVQSPYSTGGGTIPALLQGAPPGLDPMGSGERGRGSGDVPHLLVAEFQQVFRRLTSALCLIGVHHGVAGAGVGVDHHHRNPWRKAELRVVQEMRLEDEDHAVDGRLAEPVVGTGNPAHGRVRHGDEGDGVLGVCGFLGDRVERARVSERLEREGDDTDRVEPPALERACGSVRPVAQRLHRLDDPLPGRRVDVGVAVGHARNRLRRDTGVPSDIRHRRPGPTGHGLVPNRHDPLFPLFLGP